MEASCVIRLANPIALVTPDDVPDAALFKKLNLLTQHPYQFVLRVGFAKGARPFSVPFAGRIGKEKPHGDVQAEGLLYEAVAEQRVLNGMLGMTRPNAA
ncbi:hypothetical protein P0D75_26450 [Paraburkholderia sediminicola]|uniref:hypothetical protein n=1 Tax=Paraburkholderia sediminicola TaxID=458836 RepID=UPI0038B8A8E7